MNLKDEAEKHRIILGKEIRLAREAKGFSIELVAATMGIKQTTMRSIEGGRFALSVDFLIMLSMILKHEFKVMPQQSGKDEIKQTIC